MNSKRDPLIQNSRPDPGGIAVLVSVDEMHLAHVGDVAARLEAIGMKVDEILAAAGVITGSAPASLHDALSRAEGVAALEKAGWSKALEGETTA